MSTRCVVAKKVDGGFMAIYNHFDGYPDGVGAQLVADFNSEKATDTLMEKGDGSTLTESYRDRGEDDVDASFVEGKIGVLCEFALQCWGEYVYVWDGEWICYNPDTRRKLKIPV